MWHCNYYADWFGKTVWAEKCGPGLWPYNSDWRMNYFDFIGLYWQIVIVNRMKTVLDSW